MIAPGRREIISGSTKIRLIFLLVIGFSVPAFPQNADINLLRALNGDRNTSLDPAFKFVTNSVLPMAVAIPSGFITSDVLAGAVIGSGSAFLSFKLNRWINKKRVVK